MKQGALLLNDTLDMISTSTAAGSGSASTKSDGSTSLSGADKESLTLSPQLVENASIDMDSGNAPSDEEGGLPTMKAARRKWDEKEMVKGLKRGNITSSDHGDDDPAENNVENPAFEKIKLKWDDTTAKITKKKVDLLGSSSWHESGRRSKEPLHKQISAPERKGTRPSTDESNHVPPERAKEEPGIVSIPQVFQQLESSAKDDEENRALGQSNGCLEIPSAFLQTEKKIASDEQSIGIPPSPENAKEKFMSESTTDFESSTTSFLAELPPISRRRGYDDDAGSMAASTIVRGGRVIKVQAPTSTVMTSFLPASSGSRFSNYSSRPSAHKPISAHSRGSSISHDSTDGDITEYDSVVPGNESRAVARSESGSSYNVSIGTYEGEEAVDREAPLAPIESGSTEEDEVELEPLKDEALNPRQSDVEDYEEDLQEAEMGETDFIVDKVPPKKRWTSKNIHNFPVWPPVIKVQTWEKKHVSSVSIGSGFSLDDSFTDSHGIVSSLGDDGSSYDDDEFIRRPPPRQTSYRIRYDGPTTLRLLDIYRLPPGKSDDRFEPTGKPSDGLPIMPARRVVDAAPSAPPRASASSDRDDLSVTLSEAGEEEKRPDVWITAMAGTLPAEAMWRVKRVWAIETEDEKEQEHDVHNHELFEKIKSLVGAPQAPAFENTGDNAPQLPKRSWHVQTVVEKKGRVENVAAEKDLADDELKKDMVEMAKEAIKEIEENQRAFEEHKKRREEKRAEENALADVVLHLDDLEDPDEVLIEPIDRAVEKPWDAIGDPVESPATADTPGTPVSTETNLLPNFVKDDDSVRSSESEQMHADKKPEAPAKRRTKKPKKSKSSKSASSPPYVSKSHKIEPSDFPTTPRKSPTKPAKAFSTGTPKRTSKKVLGEPTDTPSISPKRSSKSLVEAPDLNTPKRKPKTSLSASKTSKSPKKEKQKKSKTKKKSKDSPKADEEKTAPKKQHVAMAAMVQDSSDESASLNNQGSSSSEDASLPDNDDFGDVTSPSRKSVARVSLAAMVHDSSESDLESIDSDDSSYGGESKGLAPRIVHQPGVSPRPGWWKTEGSSAPSRGSRRRAAPPVARPKSPPLAGGGRRSPKQG